MGHLKGIQMSTSRRSARALALSVSLAALAGEASGFDCGNCASQIFTESGTFTATAGPARVFALAVGGGAGGAKLGGGASGVAVSGVIDLPSASTEVTVGAGGEPFSTGGTAGYNGGNNNLQDDVSATDGQPSIIGSLMAAGGDGEEDSMGGIGSGGSGMGWERSSGGSRGAGRCRREDARWRVRTGRFDPEEAMAIRDGAGGKGPVEGIVWTRPRAGVPGKLRGSRCSKLQQE